MTDPHALRQEIDSHNPARAFNRRDFVRTSVGSGFAAAVLPVTAGTVIKTSADGLSVGEVTIDVAGFKMPAYRAAPAGVGNLPVVLVVSEIFGVHEHIADVARRFARQGYLAIAPELFVRQGDPDKYGEIARLMAEVIAKVPDAQVLGDLDACVAWAGANGGDTRRLGVAGFCWGGRITWLYAAHNPQVKAGVAWYGRLVGAASALTPRQPVDVAGELKAPVLGLYGEKDAGIPLESVERMKAALAQGSRAAKASPFVVYPGAGHAFHADYRPSFQKVAAEDSWLRALAWLKTHGVA
ncbi:MAG TPA: dienelactone hydrolase family protein [Burkholderiaceae bacterium]|nr:dienelactone hydrolase family protein [Burkholderiaceae bacterium]HMY99992.1 dienelactone hydrolase family protein [Burkholderiaceae bacterium]HNB45514.1 dienelactone hydrolase family protein [Burkholderiaceae bacterium]HNG78384.1 dienelactone hydrolase family protein [Burkholderiaceae bacterium]